MRKEEKKRYRKSRWLLLLLLGILPVLAACQHQDSENIKNVAARMLGKKAISYQTVSEKVKEAEEKFYYQQLNKEEQKVYQELLQGVLDHGTEIYVHSQDASRTNEILTDVLKDHPEIFWVDGTATATSHSGLQKYTSVKPGYLYSKEEMDEKQRQIDVQVADCLAGIGQTASDYEKILYVYEYIVNQVDYDENAQDNQNICSVFLGKRSVCAGYSKAMQYLLEKQGIFCTYITGTVNTSFDGNEIPHAWNLVKCNGNYYYVDVTWGDPIFQEAEGDEEENVMQEEVRDNISYDYMCCNDEELFRTHTPDKGIARPSCTKMDQNYYVVNGMYYTQYDGQAALEAMNQAISAKETKVVLKYASKSVYEEAKEDILNRQVRHAAQNLAQWYHLSQVSYSYIDDVKMNKITIFWKYS